MDRPSTPRSAEGGGFSGAWAPPILSTSRSASHVGRRRLLLEEGGLRGFELVTTVDNW